MVLFQPGVGEIIGFHLLSEIQLFRLRGQFIFIIRIPLKTLKKRGFYFILFFKVLPTCNVKDKSDLYLSFYDLCFELLFRMHCSLAGSLFQCASKRHFSLLFKGLRL